MEAGLFVNDLILPLSKVMVVEMALADVQERLMLSPTYAESIGLGKTVGGKGVGVGVGVGVAGGVGGGAALRVTCTLMELEHTLLLVQAWAL